MGIRWRWTILVYSTVIILSLNVVHVFCQNLAPYGPVPTAVLNNEANRRDLQDSELLNSLALASIYGIPNELLGLTPSIQQLNLIQDGVGPQMRLTDFGNLPAEVQSSFCSPTLTPSPLNLPLSSEVISAPACSVTPPSAPNIFPQNLVPPPIPAPTLPLPSPSPPVGIARPLVRNRQNKRVSSDSTQVISEVKTVASNVGNTASANSKTSEFSIQQIQPLNLPLLNFNAISSSQLINSEPAVICPKLLPAESNLKLVPTQHMQEQFLSVACPSMQLFNPATTGKITSTSPQLKVTPKVSDCVSPLSQKPICNPVATPSTITQPNNNIKICVDNPATQYSQPIINPITKPCNVIPQEPITKITDCPFLPTSQQFLNPTPTVKLQQPFSNTKPIYSKTDFVPFFTNPQPSMQQQTISTQSTTSYSNKPQQPFASSVVIENQCLSPAQLPCSTSTINCPKLLPQELPEKPVTTIKPFSLLQQLTSSQLPMTNYNSPQQCGIFSENAKSLSFVPQFVSKPQIIEINPLLNQQQYVIPQIAVNHVSTATVSSNYSPQDFATNTPMLQNYPCSEYEPIKANSLPPNIPLLVPYNDVPSKTCIIPNANPYKNICPSVTMAQDEVASVTVQEASSSVVLPEENYGNIEITNIVSADADVQQLSNYDIDKVLLDEVANLIINDLSNRILAEEIREISQQPMAGVLSVPPTLPTITLIPEIPIPVTPDSVFSRYPPPPLPPIIIEESRSKSKSWLPIFLIALFNNCGRCGGNGGCSNGCQNLPFCCPIPVCNSINTNGCSKSCNNCSNMYSSGNPNINIIIEEDDTNDDELER